MPNFKKNTSPAMKKSAYKMSGYSYPGTSPLNNGQKTKGEIKKKLIGPIKPMIDEDGDGIPAGIDFKDTPGGKQSNSKGGKRKPNTKNNNKKKSNEGVKEGAKRATKPKEIIQMPNPNVKPPGYGLDR